MTMYRLTAWKEEEECNFSDFTSYREAQNYGEEYYPSGYDIETVEEG